MSSLKLIPSLWPDSFLSVRVILKLLPTDSARLGTAGLGVYLPLVVISQGEPHVKGNMVAVSH